MDWEVLGPLMQQGRCPNLARLASQGAVGSLLSPPPRISPLVWTSILTGRFPEDHGVLDFFTPGPGGNAIATPSTARRAKALWNVLPEHGMRTGAVGFWATWPAEEIDGVMVSDSFAPSLFGATQKESNVVSPADWERRLAPLRTTMPDLAPLMATFIAGFEPKPQGPSEPGSLTRIQEDPVLHLQNILRSTLTYHSASLELLADAHLDTLLVYHEMVDEVCHRFMHLAPPARPGIPADLVARMGGAVQAAYELEDRLVGELLERVASDTMVIVASDHGFLSGARRLPGDPSDFTGEAAAWHRDQGVIIIRAGGVEAGTQIRGTIYDVTPTVLALLDLPAAADMFGRSLVGSEAPRIPTYGAPTPPPDATASSAGDAEEFERLRALGYVSEGASAADLSAEGFINLGVSLSYRQRHVAAQEAFRKALAVAPDNPVAIYDLAASLEDNGDAAQAYPLLDRLCRKPTRITMGALARIAEACTRGAVAPSTAREALMARPAPFRDWEWYYAMALVEKATGGPDAGNLLRRSLALGPALGQPIMELVDLTPPADRASIRALCREAIGTLPSRAVSAWLVPELQQKGEKELAAAVTARLAQIP